MIHGQQWYCYWTSPAQVWCSPYHLLYACNCNRGRICVSELMWCKATAICILHNKVVYSEWICYNGRYKNEKWIQFDSDRHYILISYALYFWVSRMRGFDKKTGNNAIRLSNYFFTFLNKSLVVSAVIIEKQKNHSIGWNILVSCVTFAWKVLNRLICASSILVFTLIRTASIDFLYYLLPSDQSIVFLGSLHIDFWKF